MTATDALRKEVKKYIDQADDKSLRIVKAILEIEQENLEQESWDDLPMELQQLIETGIKEGSQNKTISYEEVKEKYSKWFKK